MKAAFTTVFFMVLAGSMVGCGQKGPLYRDAPSEVSTEKAPAPETAADRQSVDNQSTDNQSTDDQSTDDR